MAGTGPFMVGADDPLLTRVGIRNNNPGNLRGQYFGATGNDGRFAIYPDAESGIGAVAKQLSRYYTGATTGKPLQTVSDIIGTWAPTNENNTNAYATDVARRMGVSPTDKLDLRNPEQMAQLTQAIIRHENGGDPYHPEFVQGAVAKAVPGFTGAPMADPIDQQPLGPDWYPDQSRGGFVNANTSEFLPFQVSGPALGPAMAAPTPQSPSAPSQAAPPPALSPEAMQPPPAAAPQLPGFGAARNAVPMAGPKAATQPWQSTAQTMALLNMGAGLLSGGSPSDKMSRAAAGVSQAVQHGAELEAKQRNYETVYGARRDNLINGLVKSGVPAALAQKAVDTGDYSVIGSHQIDAKPMPAGAQKMEDQLVGNLQSIRGARAQLSHMRDLVADGKLKLDPMSVKVYQLRNMNIVPGLGPTDESTNYQTLQASLHQLQGELMKEQKGAQSDKRSDLAMNVLTGGGLTNSEQALKHFDYLTNTGALSEKGLRSRVDENRKRNNKGQFDWDALEQNLPGAPPADSAKDIGSNVYGQNKIGQSPSGGPAAPASAPIGVGQSTTIGGIAVKRIQ
jgi:hypothetical protein